MKNKITYLIIAFVINFSFTNTAYCHPMVNDTCSAEPYGEIPPSDFDCGVHDAYRYVSIAQRNERA